MDPEKVAFLFGQAPVGADPDDPGDRAELLYREVGEDHPRAGVQLALRAAVADQIAWDEPPEVWRTAQRLLGDGRDRTTVMQQLVLALTPSLMEVLGDEEFDLDAYRAALEHLPIPSADECERAVLDIVGDRQSIEVDKLDELVAQRLGVDADDPVIEVLLDRVSDQLISSNGPLEMLAGDLVVHVESVTRGSVLTHRLSDAERRTGLLAAGVDLAGFRRRTELELAGGAGAITVTEQEWAGPDGWLAGVSAGALLAVRVEDGAVTITQLDDDPAVTAELVALIRSVYDDEVAEPWLPVPAEELVLGALLRDSAAFAVPTAPLSELIDVAGLHARGTDVAHESSVWDSLEHVQRCQRLFDQLGPGHQGRTALHVLGLIDDGVPDAHTAREVLDGLYDPAVLEVVPNELLGLDDDPERLQATGALAQRLLVVASRPMHQAVAHWLAALVAERRLEVVEAESHLRAAVRLDPGWPCAADRLAWYHSDRGDAVAALALWHGLGATAENSDDVRTVEPFAAPAGPKLSRNQPCWCGSGRKFKACHLGHAALAPLPERVKWLCRKATAYLERRGGPPGDVVLEHAAARAVDPSGEDALYDALDDPLVIDVVLHEGGWFDRFLTERGALLPADEALLARTWTLVDRTVYEVVEVRPGAGVGVRDLRTGDVFDVRERSFSRQARRGSLVCARAVPDGESHQFVGGIFEVAPGTERAVLDLLDERDGLALLAYVADLHRPPVIVGPDGRPIELDLSAAPAAPRPLPTPAEQEALLEFLEAQERRWCEEEVPALGGITPRQATADPTRRDELARLIASFPEVDPSTGVAALRPHRLRTLLHLPSTT
ncbi:MAG: SEC-C domain-containing protein [Pseudonocardiaceae bacterium]